MITRTVILAFLLILVLYSCKKEDKRYYVEIEIAANWELQSSDDSVRIGAIVPGSVISDLYTNLKIENPYLADNINTLQWIEKKQWVYSVIFDVALEIMQMDSVNLEFSGINGLADVILNDSLLGTVDGYFDKQLFTCKNALKVQGNKLQVKFYPVEATEKSLSQSGEQSELADAEGVESNYPVLFTGTSVSPGLRSCGIFEPVKLIAWTGAKINNVYVCTEKMDSSNAVVKVEIDIESMLEGTFDLDILVNNYHIGKTHTISVKRGIQKYETTINILNPEIWWCNGMGKQPVYVLNVVLKKDKKCIAVRKTTFGIRKVELSEVIDSVNTYHFRLNGEPVFIKGANYLPVNLLQLQPDAENYERVISKAASANINMLRVWGGGVYEKNLFYDLCDNYGIMIWQDVMIPDAEKTAKMGLPDKSIAEETKRLRNHPSVVLWYNGIEQMNTIPPSIDRRKENFIAVADSQLAVFMESVSPGIPYYSSVQDDDIRKSSKSGGFQAYWPVWYNASPLSVYTSRKSGIVSEFGVQSIPDSKTAQTFDLENEFDLRSPVTEAHQFNKISLLGSRLNGNQMIGAYVQMYYNEPANNESLMYLSQIFQAEALKFAIGNFRVNRPSCMGCLFWHFNDCWPAISWSVVDFYNRNKPSFYTVKKAYQNIAVIPEKRNNLVKLWIVNDSLSNFNGDLSVVIYDFSGKQLYDYKQEITVNANSANSVYEKYTYSMFPGKISNKVLMYATLSVKGKIIADNMLYFVDPMFLDLPEPDINMQVTNVGNRFQLTFQSRNLVKNMVLFTKGRESVFSDNNIDMLPGRPYSVNVEYEGTQSEFENDLQVITLVDSF